MHVGALICAALNDVPGITHVQLRTAIGLGLRVLCDFSSNPKWSFPSSLFVSVSREIN